jgi:hypothetical protein
MPGVHRVASLLNRWILGTHQGSVNPSHRSAPSPTATNGEPNHKMLGVEELTAYPVFSISRHPPPTSRRLRRLRCPLGA